MSFLKVMGLVKQLYESKQLVIADRICHSLLCLLVEGTWLVMVSVCLISSILMESTLSYWASVSSSVILGHTSSKLLVCPGEPLRKKKKKKIRNRSYLYPLLKHTLH